MSNKRKAGNIAGIILAITFGILAFVYIGFAVYFMGHFSCNTYVNDIPAYKLTAKDIEKEVTDGIKRYSLVINSRGGITDTITSDDISLSLRIDGQFDRALKSQNPFLWPSYFFKETRLTTDNIVVYSKQTLEEKIETLNLFAPENVREPVDAYIPDESGEDGFYIVPEDQGQSPIKDMVVEKITAALDVLEPEVTIDDECYNVPTIFQDNEELIAYRDSLNNYCKAIITYTFGDEKLVVDGTKIKEWCDIDGTSVTLNPEKVREFVNSMARQYDSFGKNRTIISHTGEEVTITGGDYGWWMDRATETSELIEAVKNGEKTDRTPVYFGTAAAYGENDWGNSYVEIDLTAQHLWVYKDGVAVIDSDFVSGCVNKGRTTPTGSYAITYKQRDATLVGENYASDVKYWMPFNGNVGMHDASWRSEFGKWYYIINGSHGCINLPTSKAAEIYEVVEKGEAVFVYGGKTEPEEVVTREVTNPETGEVTTIKMPISAVREEEAAAAQEETTQPQEEVTQPQEENTGVQGENVETQEATSETTGENAEVQEQSTVPEG
ncbi:L,D-transpeptidase family protein [Butyrivibrio sp. WCD2001]|uniref:L,D-transpeptidase family protein n=1 Tax=Butyrivibrio sp. WCD2001 TaxID=1280681 RepID=UPI00041C6E0D|nr:L,D-transpeptidase family protein [Butyrivibrio sp. WCD2001]